MRCQVVSKYQTKRDRHIRAIIVAYKKKVRLLPYAVRYAIWGVIWHLNSQRATTTSGMEERGEEGRMKERRKKGEEGERNKST
jgi:hypothetical protein